MCTVNPSFIVGLNLSTTHGVGGALISDRRGTHAARWAATEIRDLKKRRRVFSTQIKSPCMDRQTSATEVNSWPARIGVAAPNFSANSFRIIGTNDEPPVMKMASTSCVATLQVFSSRSMQPLICETSGSIQSSNWERETAFSIATAASWKRNWV